MPKVKCANCGNQMLEAYTRTGLRLYVCPHVKIRTVKKLSGMFGYGEIHCSINVKGLQASFKTLTENSNLTLEALREATKQTVNDAKLLEQANLALMLDLPANELVTLFKGAMQLGLAMGVTPEKAIESLCKGVGRRSRLILDNIGIAFKAKEAYEWFASEHNIDKLDESQRTEAWQKYAIKLIKEKSSELQ